MIRQCRIWIWTALQELATRTDQDGQPIVLDRGADSPALFLRLYERCRLVAIP